MIEPKKLVFGCYCTLAFMLAITHVVLIPVLIQLLVYSSCCIIIGSHFSIALLQSHDEDGKKVDGIETMTQKDAMMFPFVGSFALCSLYFAYKFLGQYWVNMFLSSYLTLFGIIALGETLHPVLGPLFPQKLTDKKVDFKLGLPSFLELHFKCTYTHIVMFIMSAQLGVLFVYTKYWALLNVFGIAFSIQAIRMVSLGNFTNAFLLLSGLFFYDIFWVFGTDVMVTVAKSFDAPAKLVFPVSFDPWRTSLLGLGDIVIPGFAVAMCLRFDASRALTAENKKKIDVFLSFGRPYFMSAMIWYNLALLLTGCIMIFFQHAQPALLYLVPAILISIFSTAFTRGEMKAMFQYSEEGQSEKKVEGEQAEGDAAEAEDSKKDQ